ncbi:PAS domain S-box protein [Undibacterium sp. Di26W]|uniref:PAS domain S-box protein n=1 Tax=Undibacterium sp. Di26W TaxID=3413035 RepID=UPI003BF0BF10
MPSSFLPAAIISSLVASLLTMLVLFYVQHLNVHARTTRCWALAYAFLVLRGVCSLLALTPAPLFALGADISLLAYVCFLWAGTRIFYAVTVYVMPVMLGFSLAVMWLLMTYVTGATLFWRTLPVYFSAGCLLIAAAMTFWRMKSGKHSLGYIVLGALIFLKGAHLLDFPLLRDYPEFASLGFGIGAFLDLAIGMLFMVAALLRQQEDAYRTNENLLQEIQERQHIERMSKERNALFEKVFQLVPDVLTICREKDGCYLDVNRHWETVTGYSRDETLGRISLEMNLWADPSKRPEMLAILARDGEVNNYETIYRHKQGHEYHVLISGTRFDAGSEPYIAYAMQDVTALRRVEKLQVQVERELQEREKLLATVFQLVPDILTITKMATGQYIEVNRNWEPMSGFTREYAIGRTSNEMNLWAKPEQRDELIARIKHDGEVRDMHVSFRRKTGVITQCRISGSKFEAGNEEYLLLSSRNIDSEIAADATRLQVESLLRENEHKYSTLFQLSPIPLGLVDVKADRIVEVNDVWLKEFGYTRDEVVGQLTSALGFDAQVEKRKEFDQALLRGKKVDQMEVHLKSKDGTSLIFLLSARLIKMRNKRMCIFSLLNVTRQVEVEHEIREMTAQLEERVKLRTLNLQQANAELASAMASLRHTQDELVRAEKMAALGSLVAGVAHELNTPIGNSVTVASTLQDKTKDLMADLREGRLKRSMLDTYVDTASKGTELLMRTLGMARELIRSFKQVAVDQSSSHRRNFDLQTVLEELIVTMAPMYKNSPYTLLTDLAPGIGMDSYPGPLGQIVTNFMTNALTHGFEHRTSGEMRLITHLQDDGSVQIIFSDNGIGMNEHVKKRVFDPFFTTKLGQGGSGLGMNIVYNLVTGVLGGEIQLHSQLDEGTTFIMTLPLVAPQIANEKNARGAGKGTGFEAGFPS